MTSRRPSALEATLDRLHARARRSGMLLRLVVGTRILLAVAFLPTGMVKLLGRPFTTMGRETPIGEMFAVLHASGGYWQFIGAMQILAALCLLVPVTRTLGAVLFAPIIANICAITWAWGFGNTAYFVTTPMVLATLLLLAWDYPRLKGILFAPREDAVAPEPAVPLRPWERWAYVLGAVGLFWFFGAGRFGSPAWMGFALAAVAGLAVVVGGTVVCFRAWRTRGQPA